MVSRLLLFVVIVFGSAFMLGYGSNIEAADIEIPAIENLTAVGVSGPLDGMKFVGDLGPEGKPKDVTDVFVFRKGTFVSEECELRCEYPARPYFIRETESEIEFVSKTKCPYKDADIVWHGTVKGNKIVGTATWTIRRWYWTMTNTFEFAGTLNKVSDHIASTN